MSRHVVGDGKGKIDHTRSLRLQVTECRRNEHANLTIICWVAADKHHTVGTNRRLNMDRNS